MGEISILPSDKRVRIAAAVGHGERKITCFGISVSNLKGGWVCRASEEGEKAGRRLLGGEEASDGGLRVEMRRD